MSHENHWHPKRKAKLLESISRGEIARGEAIAQHGLSDEELTSWERLYQKFGAQGLRVTRLHQYQPHRRPKYRRAFRTADTQTRLNNGPKS